jgi:cysteinyl-tRNA synthetase
MEHQIQVYNSLTRKKETFIPLKPPFVGMYVCGPTVYGYPHLGHARPYVTFDLVYRYLTHKGYKVRYVRNITDVGHLENDADEGEDKIEKKARLEQLEPMEVAHHYTTAFEKNMDQLNILTPSIEPRASGHIIEQIALIKKIIDAGLAYEVNGSVYFDVEKYNEHHHYGILSGRVLEDMQAGAGTRTLEGQDEKRNKADFALWKKANPEHIMRWPSPWGDGFPGWHVECSAMSAKYLGLEFDIHGGGMDLLFPHHECEIAQSVAGNGRQPVKYWIHNNMLTINGQKMGKSLGNFITLDELFSGSRKEVLDQAYSPMTIRFFILQAHYRSTLDFSNAALQAAEKGLARLMQASQQLDRINPGSKSTMNIEAWVQSCYDAMDDDFNSAILIANLFEAASWINQLNAGQGEISENDLKTLKEKYKVFITDILGLIPETSGGGDKIDGLMHLIIDLRKRVREQKDFQASDKIRDELSSLGFVVKDTKDGVEWSYN